MIKLQWQSFSSQLTKNNIDSTLVALASSKLKHSEFD